MTTLLLDGDIVVYRCGFAAEKVKYTIKYSNFNDLTPHETSFNSKKETEGFLKENPYIKYEIIKTIDVEPLFHALGNVNILIRSLQRKFETEDTIIFLSGSESYRDKIAKQRPYKGNRDPDHKPVYYKEIKEYLTRFWCAEITVGGYEADDYLGLAQGWRKEPIICSIDKDLFQIKGLHYNWVTDELNEVNEQDAVKFYYLQLLSGDPVDNIVGIPGIGWKKAVKYLDNVYDENELLSKVIVKYKEVYKEGWAEVLLEHEKLIGIHGGEAYTNRIKNNFNYDVYTLPIGGS